MVHSITRPRQFTGIKAIANRMQARQLQALRYAAWVESRRQLEDVTTDSSGASCSEDFGDMLDRRASQDIGLDYQEIK